MAQFPAPKEGIALTHFIVARDVERSRRFYVEVLGGEVVLEGEPSIVALANGWIIINVGGGPTDDKPTVTLEPPSDLDRASAFLNIRVADIDAVHRQWSARGATFLTPPIERFDEVRCYMRDPMATSSRWDRSWIESTGDGAGSLAGSLRCYASLCDPIGNRTFPGRFDDNHGTTRTCIECRGVSGSSWSRALPPGAATVPPVPRRHGNHVTTANYHRLAPSRTSRTLAACETRESEVVPAVTSARMRAA